MASDALSLLGDEIDVLITVLIMPYMHGMELISRVRQLRYDLPVLIILQRPFAIGKAARRVRELIARPGGWERRFRHIEEIPVGAPAPHGRIAAKGEIDRSHDWEQQ
jgi:hypothetical protein